MDKNTQRAEALVDYIRSTSATPMKNFLDQIVVLNPFVHSREEAIKKALAFLQRSQR